MENSMWSRESSPDVQVVDLKISVRQRILSKARYIGADEFTLKCISGKYTDLYGTGEKWMR